MKNKQPIYLLLTTALFCGCYTANKVSAQTLFSNSGSRVNNSVSLFSLTESRLIEKIANTEVERILLGSRYTFNSPEYQRVNTKLYNLQNKLLEIQPNSRSLMNKAISKAIKAKIVELEITRGIQQASYVSDSPVIQILGNDIKSLRQRFLQIQPENSEAEVNLAVSRSMKIKITELKIESKRLKNTNSSTDINVVVINEQITQLQKRLAMFI